MTRRTNARIAGFTFLFYIAAGITTPVLSGRATQGEGIPAKLASIAQHTVQLIYDTAHGFVKAPEPDGSEVDVPKAVVDFLQADLELREQGGRHACPLVGRPIPKANGRERPSFRNAFSDRELTEPRDWYSPCFRL